MRQYPLAFAGGDGSELLGTMDRINQSWGQFESTVDEVELQTGVNVAEVPILGKPIRDVLNTAKRGLATAVGAGTTAASATGLIASGSGPIAAAVAGLGATGVGAIVAGTVAAGFAAIQAVRLVSCVTKGDNRRASYRQEQDRIKALIMTPETVDNAAERKKIGLRLDEWAPFASGAADVPLGKNRAPLTYGGWSDVTTLPADFAWVDGSTGTKRGASARTRGEPCKRYELTEGMLAAMRALRVSLEGLDTVFQRRAAFISSLAVHLGHLGNPLVGLEASLDIPSAGAAGGIRFGHMKRYGARIEYERGTGPMGIEYAALITEGYKIVDGRLTDTTPEVLVERSFQDLQPSESPLLMVPTDQRIHSVLAVRFASGDRLVVILNISPGEIREWGQLPDDVEDWSYQTQLPGGPVWASNSGSLQWAEKHADILDRVFPWEDRGRFDELPDEDPQGGGGLGLVIAAGAAWAAKALFFS